MNYGAWLAIAITVCYLAWLITTIVRPLPPADHVQIALLENPVCASPVCDLELDADNVGSVTAARIEGINASLIYCKEHS